MIGTSGRTALALGSSSRPLIPGMLMSDRIRMSEALAASLMRCSAAGADWANSMVKRPARRSRRNCWRNSISTSGSSSTTRMRKLTRVLLSSVQCRRLRGRTILNSVNLPGSVSTAIVPACCFTMMSWLMERPEPGALASRLGGEERIEHLVLHLGRNAGAVVANPDFDAVAEVFGRSPPASARNCRRRPAPCAWSRHRSRLRSD